MGNKLTLLSKTDEKAIQNKIRAYGEDFLARFSQAYKECLVYSYIDNECKNNPSSSSSPSSSGVITAPSDLLSAAKPVSVLCSGSMLKRRGQRGRWRQYYFEARNKADNYDIFYYVESNSGKLTFKDRLDCYSYHLESLSEDETSINGELALKLISYDDLPEHWFLPQTTSEHKAWETAFMMACQRAAPPQPDDPLITKAFTKSMCRMRCSLGIYDAFVMKTSVHDTLESFLEAIIQREPNVLSSTLNELVMNEHDANIREESISSILDSVNMMVKHVVADVWKRCLQEVDNANLSLKGRIEYSLYDIIAGVKTINSSIHDYYTAENVQSMMNNSLNSNAYRPVLEMSVKSITEAFQEAASAFHHDILSSLENARSSLTSLSGSESKRKSSCSSSKKEDLTSTTTTNAENGIESPIAATTTTTTTDNEDSCDDNTTNVATKKQEEEQVEAAEEAVSRGNDPNPHSKVESDIVVEEEDDGKELDRDNRHSDRIFTESAVSDVVKDISTQLDRPPSQITLIGNAQMILWDWYTDVLADHADILPDSNVVFELHTDILEILTDLIRNAIFTFTVLVTNGGAEHHTYNSLQRTLERLQVDMEAHQKMICLRLLTLLTDAEVHRHILGNWWSNEIVHQAIQDAHLTGNVNSNRNSCVDNSSNDNGNTTSPDENCSNNNNYYYPLQNTVDNGGMQKITIIDKSIIDLVSVREIGEREIRSMASVSLNNLLKSVSAKLNKNEN